jgi:hypothetical protein
MDREEESEGFGFVFSHEFLGVWSGIGEPPPSVPPTRGGKIVRRVLGKGEGRRF